jgi:hypothetical protein
LKRALVGLAAFALFLPSLAQASKTVVLAPLKPWNLHYAENSCQLIRSFGDPARPTVMVLERIAPDMGMSLLVYGGSLTARVGGGKAKASFVPFTDRSFDDGEITETTTDRRTAILWPYVDLLPRPQDDQSTRKPEDRSRDLAEIAAYRELEQSSAARITGLQVREPGGRITLLQTGSLAKVHAMMRDCAKEQMVSWGLDPATEDRIVLEARSKRKLATYFDVSDYPDEAASNGQQSIISARLIVGADGKVISCTPLTRFVGEGFKEVVCRKLSKATFDPAELADGTKVPTFVTARIKFEMH